MLTVSNSNGSFPSSCRIDYRISRALSNAYRFCARFHNCVVTSTSIVIHSISPSPLPNRVLKLVILLHLHPRVYSSDRSSPEQQLHVVLGVVQRIRVSSSIVLFTPIELKLIFCPFRFLLHLLHLLGFVSHPGVLLPKLLQLFLSFSFRLLAFVSLVLSLRPSRADVARANLDDDDA